MNKYMNTTQTLSLALALSCIQIHFCGHTYTTEIQFNPSLLFSVTVTLSLSLYTHVSYLKRSNWKCRCVWMCPCVGVFYRCWTPSTGISSYKYLWARLDKWKRRWKRRRTSSSSNSKSCSRSNQILREREKIPLHFFFHHFYIRTFVFLQSVKLARRACVCVRLCVSLSLSPLLALSSVCVEWRCMRRSVSGVHTDTHTRFVSFFFRFFFLWFWLRFSSCSRFCFYPQWIPRVCMSVSMCAYTKSIVLTYSQWHFTIRRFYFCIHTANIHTVF